MGKYLAIMLRGRFFLTFVISLYSWDIDTIVDSLFYGIHMHSAQVGFNLVGFRLTKNEVAGIP